MRKIAGLESQGMKVKLESVEDKREGFKKGEGGGKVQKNWS